MHTYQTVKKPDGSTGFQAGVMAAGPTAEQILRPLGPVFDKEEEAASFASFMNGGRWSPGELAGVLPPPPPSAEEEAEKAREARRATEKGGNPNRPEGLKDYPHEEDRAAHPGAAPKAKAHAAHRKPEVKRAHPKRKR